MNIQKLRIPGPTPVPPSVISALRRPMIPHRGHEFRALHVGMIEKLKAILRTRQDVFVVPGSGSIGWEAAIVNTLSPGDPIVAFITGDFGHRFASVAERFGLDVRRVEIDAGDAATPGLVQHCLDRYPEARAVLYTHNETSTGVINPLVEVSEVVRRHGALLLVDAVSSAGAVMIEMDELGVDVLISGSQKGWMCPPGLAIVAASERAIDAGRDAGFPRSFLDFGSWRSSASKGDTPATAPLSMYFALDAACDLILEEGMSARTERHMCVAANTRATLSSAGFTVLARDESFASPTVTAARPPEGSGAKSLVNMVRERYDIEVAAGQAELSDQIIRIGHMGWFYSEDIARTAAAVVACATAQTEQSQGR